MEYRVLFLIEFSACCSAVGGMEKLVMLFIEITAVRRTICGMESWF